MADHYRQAASILVLKPTEDGAYQILLLHKPRKNDAWQLPQGGVENEETIEQAAIRELHEEAGITGVKVIGGSEKCYQYDFPDSYRKFRADNVCGQCIHYVYALAPNDVAVIVDAKEVDGYIWVSLDQVPHYVKREAYKTLVEDLYGEAIKIMA